MSKKKKALIISLISVGALIVLLLLGTLIYLLSGTYEADNDAILAFGKDADVTEIQGDGYIAFMPESARAGFIFYPGGKVDEEAYVPLMRALASNGILSVLVPMPFDLAVFGVNGADGVMETFPEVQDWYIGGHSLGGAMACSYISDKTDKFKGVVLLGAYSTVDFSDTSLDILCIYGSEDGVLNYEKYEECISNLPSDYEEFKIEGGNHAYFGMYGEQDGDGIAKITNEKQIHITADKIVTYILGDLIK